MLSRGAHFKNTVYLNKPGYKRATMKFLNVTINMGNKLTNREYIQEAFLNRGFV